MAGSSGVDIAQLDRAERSAKTKMETQSKINVKILTLILLFADNRQHPLLLLIIKPSHQTGLHFFIHLFSLEFIIVGRLFIRAAKVQLVANQLCQHFVLCQIHILPNKNFQANILIP
jgi:hypothetical protein